MTKSEVAEWRSFSVTKEVFAVLQDRVEQLEYELSITAGLDPLEDRFKCGALAAYKDVLQVEVDTND